MTQVANILQQQSHRAARQFWLSVSLLGFSVIVLSFASLMVGQVPLGWHDLKSVLLGEVTPRLESARLIFLEVRLPRTLMALLVGGSLGLSGAALQGYLRNPLAEPGIIGVSGGAALGAVLVLYTGLSAAFLPALPLGGLAGAAVAAILVQLLAGRSSTSLTLILAGVAITSFTGAMTSLALNLAPSPYAALEIVYWLMGSLEDRSFEHVWLALPFILAGWLVLLTTSRALDSLSLGELSAKSLGVNLSLLKTIIIFGAALCVGSSTAVAGVIGFVGLVVPHIMRPLAGQLPSRLLVLSLFGGALLLLSADIFIRSLTLSRELNIGVVTAIIGAPFFLLLIQKMRRGELS